ncbi:MAG: hypothetical protein HRU19_20620 [Pseudobacteriovorax sp.]|nr:hypothetical protein [Pseudobacteriovorax sp.]
MSKIGNALQALSFFICATLLSKTAVASSPYCFIQSSPDQQVNKEALLDTIGYPAIALVDLSLSEESIRYWQIQWEVPPTSEELNSIRALLTYEYRLALNCIIRDVGPGAVTVVN